MKELIQKLESADFTGDEIRIETDKYILILSIYHSLDLFIPELHDYKTLQRLYIERSLIAVIYEIYQQKHLL